MNDIGYFEMIVRLIEMLIDQMWQFTAGVFDLARHIGPLGSGMIVVGVCSVAMGVAWAMQRRLNKKLEKDPKESVSMLGQEVAFSLPAVALFIVMLPFLIIRWVVGAAGKFIMSLVSSSDDKAKGEEEEEEISVVVATIGPSFMWAGLIVAGLYVFGRVSEPLLRYQFDLSDGYPAWQYLIMGDRPELEWYLPLERFPYLGALVATGLWMTIWWWAGRIVRIVLGSELGSNLAEKIENRQVLKSWRTWFGSRMLFEPDTSYRAWAKWLPVAAVPFLIWSWGTLSTEPYRMGSSMFAVSLVLWLSWVIHVNLIGHWHMVEDEAEPEPEPEAPEGRDWSNVLEDLQVRLQVEEPFAFDAPRVVEPLEPASRAPKHGLISPLLGEVLPDEAGLTHMQQAVLETLSHQAYVHVDPPTVAGELELGRTGGAGIEDESGLRHRNQVVLAPDGSGKTTLAMLAACNHVLVHTRATLVVTRDEASAERFCSMLRSTLEPSTLRWTVRVRQAGSTLVNDLSQGIIPDVIVTSLRQLVVGILNEPRTYAPFLKNLGLIVVDDVESFCGPVEIHMQLAFRRLTLRVRELLGTRQLGEESAPVTLLLGVDSMHDTPTWAKTLCGIDAVTRVFEYGRARRSVPRAGSPASKADETAKSEAGHLGLDSGGLAALTDAEPGRYHLFYQLSDFVSESGESLSVHDLIESCERLGIPWHYRTCGDAHRRKGRQNLKLEQEPQHDVSSPLDAGVVFLAGHVSTVRREIDHLLHAGVRFQPDGQTSGQQDAANDRPVPIAFVSVVDPDERMALTELNPNSSLADVVETLPRPVVRAPFGRAVEAHLSADLVDTWMEVADILDVFGNTTVHTLGRLADSGLLVHESRTDLDAEENDYEKNMYVRVPAKAVASEEGEEDRGRTDRGRSDRSEGVLLPPKVSQVERPSGATVAIRDRTNLTIVEVTDRISARHVYYPGRIFETAQGRYVVVGAAADAAKQADGGAVSENDILVEPFLNDDVSSPRRRSWFRPLRASEALPGERQEGRDGSVEGAASEGHDAEPVFIGDYPVSVSLGPVECRTRHLATFRLDPHNFAVRQKLLYTASQAAHTVSDTMSMSGKNTVSDTMSAGAKNAVSDTVRTVALGIIANPHLDIVADAACPKLELRDARLIAAAMRAVLPSMYRGSDVDIQVALHIAADNPDTEYVLGSDDGFYLYDPHLGGNGAAQAIHRDGVELLLRLCRVYLERVLYHDRLRARYDYWANEDELVGRRRRTDKGPQDSERERDQQARKRALTWLDSRLRPEGSVTGGKRRGSFGVGSEEGEGDVFDIGRCWYSEDGTVTDLIWTKHRWMLDDGTEAMCDVGIGRKTAAKARTYTAEPDAGEEAFAEHLAWVSKQLDNPAFELDDQTIWGRPAMVWSLEAGDEIPSGSDANLLRDEAVIAYQKLALAVACDNYAALGPLADLLAQESDADLTTPEGRLTLTRFVTDFVQGIPFASKRQPHAFEGPIRTLLYRLGNQESQTLLLALLLKHAGVDSGLFWHPETGRMMTAAALPKASTVETGEQMLTWRERFGRDDRRLIWGELEPQPGSGGQYPRVYLPIATDKHEEIAGALVEKPEQWVFLPLAAAWLRLGIEQTEIPGGE
ncbi:DEAD/DEAH box helicase [Persicimonas caeni]|uniref:DEAD/DEAH box helicase n=1 Tax=Persicimonas caeni TaxID=2292766 RepID=A0A4Y6PWU6_PERCE|nr:DEAD/DEAH box helicase [Persicimonas caeni]QDG52609.1 DEAD/DEAH box helicase [Persicimonas caeni]QED33831.1 DEAD/DEAH box helicase [Persicimonas caeni]